MLTTVEGTQLNKAGQRVVLGAGTTKPQFVQDLGQWLVTDRRSDEEKTSGTNAGISSNVLLRDFQCCAAMLQPDPSGIDMVPGNSFPWTTSRMLAHGLGKHWH